VRAIGVNPVDWKMRSADGFLGLMQRILGPSGPLVIGIDFAGEVVEVGAKVTELDVGARVVGGTDFSRGQRGSYADEVIVRPDQCAVLPDSVTFEAAACLPVAAVTAGMALTEHAGSGADSRVLVLGASGGVAAVLILFALNYPHRTVLFMFIIPMPMWVLACFMLGMDVMGAVGAATELRGGRIAFTAHLAGAAYAFIYFRTGWSPGNWLGNKFSGVSLKRKPNLRVHQPSDSEDEAENEMDKVVDDILKKIHDQGQDSLTRRERRILARRMAMPTHATNGSARPIQPVKCSKAPHHTRTPARTI